MNELQIRPRFKHKSALPMADLKQRLKQALMQKNAPFKSTTVLDNITLTVPVEKQHFWSPQLSLTFESIEGGTLIRGLFGPNPSVWAVFFFAYVALGIISLFALIYGSAEVVLGESAPVLFAIPVCVVLALGLFIAAKTGQKLGREEMEALQAFYQEAVGAYSDSSKG